MSKNKMKENRLKHNMRLKDLAEETTKKYIEIMIKKRIGENELLELIEKLLEMSHAFIKEKSDK